MNNDFRSLDQPKILRREIRQFITRKKTEARKSFKAKPLSYYVTTRMDEGTYRSFGNMLTDINAAELHLDFFVYLQKHLIKKPHSKSAQALKLKFVLIAESKSKYRTDCIPHCHSHLWINPALSKLGSNPLQKIEDLTHRYSEQKKKDYGWSHEWLDLRESDDSPKLNGYNTKNIPRQPHFTDENVLVLDEASLETIFQQRSGTQVFDTFGALINPLRKMPRVNLKNYFATKLGV